jgi:hypothetical protein
MTSNRVAFVAEYEDGRKESATVLHKFAEASDRIQSSTNASSIASNGATIEGRH